MYPPFYRSVFHNGSIVVFFSVTTVSAPFLAWNVTSVTYNLTLKYKLQTSLPTGNGNGVNRCFLAGEPARNGSFDPPFPEYSGWKKKCLVLYYKIHCVCIMKLAWVVQRLSTCFQCSCSVIPLVIKLEVNKKLTGGNAGVSATKRDNVSTTWKLWKGFYPQTTSLNLSWPDKHNLHLLDRLTPFCVVCGWQKVGRREGNREREKAWPPAVQSPCSAFH